MGLVWESMSEVEKVWESMRKYEKVLSMRKYVRSWESMRKHDKVWESMRKYEKVLGMRKLVVLKMFCHHINVRAIFFSKRAILHKENLTSLFFIFLIFEFLHTISHFEILSKITAIFIATITLEVFFIFQNFHCVELPACF